MSNQPNTSNKKKIWLIIGLVVGISSFALFSLVYLMFLSTFFTKEPAVVITPPSVADQKVPEANLVKVLINKDGKIWLTMKNDTSKSWSNEEIRKEMLVNAANLYNETYKPSKEVKFTPKQLETFAKLNSFGVPMEDMAEWLDLAGDPATVSKADDWLSGKMKDKTTGIPIKWNQDQNKPTEFQIWMLAMRGTSNENFNEAIQKGKGVAIKTDGNTSFDVIHMVMDNLQTIHMNKFTLMTALKESEDTKGD